jgi:cobalt transporter subunit CbtA
MIARVLLAVVLCGLAAGFAMGVMQHVRLTPILMFAETFEKAETSGHSHDAAAPHEHAHGAKAWMPQDGFERTAYTYATAMIAAAGFAGILAGLAFTLGHNITPQTGWIWGMCGFLAFSLAPAAGLPPELPGMPVADLTMRQIWWISTVIATGVSLWLLAFKREAWAIVLAFGVLLLPHLIGAPQPENHGTGVPASLASDFAGSVLAANAVMWLLIGTLLGRFWPAQNLEETS